MCVYVFIWTNREGFSFHNQASSHTCTNFYLLLLPSLPSHTNNVVAYRHNKMLVFLFIFFVIFFFIFLRGDNPCGGHCLWFCTSKKERKDSASGRWRWEDDWWIVMFIFILSSSLKIALSLSLNCYVRRESERERKILFEVLEWLITGK